MRKANAAIIRNYYPTPTLDETFVRTKWCQNLQ